MNGYFRKPLGIPKPKGIQFSQPLVLDLIEGYYLTLKSEMKLHAIDGRPMSISNIKSLCKNQYDEFDTKYLVFQEGFEIEAMWSHLVSNLVLGFAYVSGAGIDYAPYLVKYTRPGFDIAATSHCLLAGRLATTVKKRFLL